MIKISKRLEAIAQFVPENRKIIDIGCDHALLDIYLAQTKPNTTIIASDINANALQSAKKNIKKSHLEDKIQTRLGSGLDTVEKDEINTIILSGLGTHTIVGIIVNNLKKLEYVDDIIIQSNTNIEFLRKKITSNNYYIAEEKLIKDAKIIYTIIHFKKGKRKYNSNELFFGPILIKENSQLFQEKKAEDLQKLKSLYQVIPKKYLFYRLKVLRKIHRFKQKS